MIPVALFFVFSMTGCYDRRIDRSKYVDPGDLGSFDYNRYLNKIEEDLKAEVNPTQSCKESGDIISREEYTRLREELTSVKQELQSYKDMMDKTQVCSLRVNSFFQRLAKVLANRGLRLKDEISLSSILKYHVSRKTIDRLQELKVLLDRDPNTPTSKYVDQVSDILIPLINKSYVEPEDSFWIRHFDSVTAVSLILVSLLVTYLVVLHRFKTVLAMVFLVSVVWEWKKLYEEEVSRQLSSTKLQSCQAKSSMESVNAYVKSFWTGIQSLVMITAHADSGDNRCHDYYSSLGVKTILKVNPSMAVSNVLGSTFGNTLSILSKYSGQGFQNFFAHVPLLWTPIVLPLLVVVLVVVLVFLCGYDIRTPLLSLRRSTHGPSFTQTLQSSQEATQLTASPTTQTHITYHDNRRVIQVADQEVISGDSLPFIQFKIPRISVKESLGRQESSSTSSSIEVVDSISTVSSVNQSITSSDLRTVFNPSSSGLRRIRSMSSIT